MRRSQRQRFQPSRLDYRLPGVPSSTPTAAQFLQIPSAAETSPEQRSTPVRQFDRSVRDGEIEDTIQRLQGEMDAITRELGELNVRCSSSSDSRHGFDSRYDFDSRRGLDTRHDFESRYDFDSRRGLDTRHDFETRYDFDSRRGLDTREDFESRPARKFDTRYDFDSRRGLDTRHNFKFESPPARNFESRYDFDSRRGLDTRHDFDTRYDFDSRRGLDTRHDFDTRRGLDTRHDFESHYDFDSRPRFDFDTRHRHGVDSRYSWHQSDDNRDRPRYKHDFRTRARNPQAPTLVVTEVQKLDIMDFDGSPESYPYFKVQVEDAIKSGYYSEAKILSHLKEKLKGSAFQAVRASLLMGGSLFDIMNVIQKRFGDPRIVVRHVTRKLLERQKIRQHDVADLVTFSVQINNTLSILKAMQFERELDNTQSISELVSKLPPGDIERWGEYGRRMERDGRAITFESFAFFLSDLVEDRQFAIPTALCSSKTETRNEKVKQSFAASSVQQDPVKDKDVRRKQIKCYYCSGSHHIRICPKFTSLSVQERNQWVATKKVCQWCFSATHSLKDCKRKKLCGKNGCTEKHDSLCHVDVIAPAPVVGATSLKTATTIMKTVAIDVFDREGKTHRCVAYLDEGSAISLVDEQLIQELELHKGERTSLKMKTLSGLSEQTSFKVDLHIVSVKDGRRYSLTDVYTTSSLSIDGQAVRMTKLEQQFPEIGSLEIPDFTERPKILIGVDHIDLIATRQLRRVGGANGPLLQRTKLGWTLTGKVIMTTCLQDSTPVNFAGVDHDPPFDQMDALVRSTWKTECFGTKYKDSVPRSREDRLAMSILRNEVFHDGERWVAPLLRRSREEELPRSRDMAERTAISFEKRLDRATATHEAERKRGPSLSEMTFSDGENAERRSLQEVVKTRGFA